MLHDAFFKYQTKPKLTAVGEMYYEGKEFEAAITHARPGGPLAGRSGRWLAGLTGRPAQGGGYWFQKGTTDGGCSLVIRHQALAGKQASKLTLPHTLPLPPVLQAC